MPDPLFDADEKRPFTLAVYMRESRGALHSLVFVLPVLLGYEIGIRVVNAGQTTPVINGADALIKRALGALGLWGSLLSALSIIVVLLMIHMHSGRPWRVRPATLGAMALESLLMSLPVLLLAGLVRDVLSNPSSGPSPTATLVFMLGAGVYEEFLFRLLLLGGLLFAAKKLFHSEGLAAQMACILVSSLCFAAFHYIPPHGDEFTLYSFAFRTVAGLYFAWLYGNRGYGVAAGAHTAYNVIVQAGRLGLL